jgi:CHAD domain-containing protein
MSAPRLSWVEHARASLLEALQAAAERFPRPGEDGAQRIHDARKELKRSASIARLFAPIAGAPAYGTLDVVDAARRWVGRARDLDILPATLDRLKCPSETRDILMRAIAVERGEARGEHASGNAERFGSSLREAAARVAEWDLAGHDLDALLRSLRATYRSAKRRGRFAFSTVDADDLHDLRARVVDLSHQCALFEAAWPALLAAQGAELHRLRQALGDHNDLTVLGEFALSRRELPSDLAEELGELVLRRRRPLERRAAAQFERAFAERPGAFARRIGAYLAHPQGKLPVMATAPAREDVSV